MTQAINAPVTFDVTLTDEFGRDVLTFKVTNDKELTKLEGLPEGWTYKVL